jgi:NAD-dependent dihydropyrimidine dehydrogenase PreA subunit
MTEKVTVDFNACKECGYCSMVCPKQVFSKGKEYNSRGYLAYVAVNADSCIGCEKCFYACPDFAISVNK